MKTFNRQISLLFLSLVLSFPLFSQTPIRVVCVGNSITEGFGLSDPAKQAYPVQLGTLLGSGYSVLNCGLSGRTLLKKGDVPYWNESRFTDAKNFNAQIVIIALGTNDSKSFNWIHKSEFYSDYAAMVGEFRKNGKNPHIFVCLPPPAFIDNYSITDSVIRNEMIPLIDSICYTLGTSKIDYFHNLLPYGANFADGIHPNLQGAAVMAQIAYKAITKPLAITSVFSPQSKYSQSANEWIAITINNNKSVPLTKVPVAYKIDNNSIVRDTIALVPANTEVRYQFPKKADLSQFKEYSIKVYTEAVQENDTLQVKVLNVKPNSDLGLVFAGDNGIVRIPHSDKLLTPATFTVEAWVYPTIFRKYVYQGTILSKEQQATNRGYILSMGGDGQAKFGISDGGWKTATAPVKSLVLNKWQHIAGVSDGTSVKIYIDGVLKATTTAGAIKPSTGELWIGQTTLPALDRAYIGAIDEVRIWNTALTETQINETKGHQLWGNEAGLAAYYKLNDGFGSRTTKDLAGGKTGIIQNMDVEDAWMLGAGLAEKAGAPQNDVAIFNVLAPKTRKGLSDKESVTVKVFNYSDVDQLNVPISYKIDNKEPIHETIAKIPAQSSVDFTFTEKANLSEFKIYTVLAYTSLNGDAMPGNDSVSVSVKCIDPNIDQALLFSGSNNSAVNIPNATSLMPTAAFTIQAWVYPKAFRTNIWEGTVVSKETSSGGFALGVAASGQGRFVIGSSNWYEAVTPVQSVELNKWTHVAAVYDGSSLKVYINGVLKATKTGVGAIKASTSSLYIGASSEFAGREFNGGIDEVSLWNKALTATEILSRKDFSLSGKEDGLVAYYKLNEGPGSTEVIDSTGNGHNGTFQNLDIEKSWMPGAGLTPTGIVAVRPIAVQPMVSVSPNPAKDFINVKLNQKGVDVKIIMTDLMGKTVVSRDLKSVGSDIVIDVRNFTNGLYLLRLSSVAGQETFKVLVN